MKKWIVRGLKAYALIVAVNFAYALGSLWFPALLDLERRLFKPVAMVWLTDTDWVPAQNLTIGGEPLRISGEISEQQPESLVAADIHAIFVNGFAELTDVPGAAAVGVNWRDYQDRAPGSLIEIGRVQFSFNFALLPFRVTRRTLIIKDLSTFNETYRVECGKDLLGMWALGDQKQDLIEQCKLNPGTSG